ncbi:MAG: MBL fold metallo-hydrolase [Candidatus Woesearchaeota archaeon]
MVSITKLTIGDLPTNCYVLSENGSCIVVDSGSDYIADIRLIRNSIGDNQLLAVICTHNHFDHIMGAHHFEAPCYLHGEDIETLEQSKVLSKRIVGVDMTLPADLRPLSEDMSLGPFSFKALYTPGHSPGSCLLFFEEEGILLSGDTLFAGACGRTDLPGSDLEAMNRSLRRLLELPDNTAVYPGHGPKTSIGAEREWLERFLSP